MASQVEDIKWVPGTSFIVDGFAFQSPKCSHYFLTHFHSDHTVGLNRGFKGGTIYCSPVTAQLLVYDMRLRPEVVRPLEVGKPVGIAGVRVTPLDANHCPGAVMFLFEVPVPAPGPAAAAAHAGSRAGLADGCGAAVKAEAGAAGMQVDDSGWNVDGVTHNVLHTGDCRWQPWMRQQPGLAGVRIDTLFLDTTYAAPKHTHPPQQQAVDMMVQAMREALAEEPRTLFLLAAYHIGKERAFLGAAQQLGARVWCSPAKRSVLRLLDLPPRLTALLADDPRDASLHVTGWGLRPEDMQAYLDQYPGMWSRAVGIRPTGWTFRRSGGLSVRREGNVSILGVPYSEHSSWTDLCDAVSQLRPRRLVPTVNAATPARRRALVDLFAHLMDLSADRSRLDVYLTRGGRASSASAAGATQTARLAFSSAVQQPWQPDVVDLSQQDDDGPTEPLPVLEPTLLSERSQPVEWRGHPPGESEQLSDVGKRARTEAEGKQEGRAAKRRQLLDDGATTRAGIDGVQGGRVCVLDLTGDEDDECGSGMCANGGRAELRAGQAGDMVEEHGAVASVQGGMVPASSRGASRAGLERQESGRGSWQSSIRRFFAPVRRIAAAMV